MTSRTRYFLTGSAVIILVGLGTGLVAYYRGDLPRFKSRIGPDELSYVAPDATGVAYANVREFMNSDFGKKLHATLPPGQGKDEFLNETGIDIERDIQSVVAASSGPGDPKDNGLVLIRGTFDEGRIESLMRQHGGTVEDYNGKRLLVTGPADHPVCLVFAESGLVMFGPEAAVKHAFETHASHQDITSKQDIAKLISELDGVGNTAWAVGGIDALTSNPSVPAPVKAQLPGIEWVAVSARVSNGLSGDLRAEAKDDKAAADLRAVVNGAIAAGHLMTGQNAKLDAFLNSLQVSGAGKDLNISFTVPPEMLDMAGSAIGGRRGAPAPRETRPPASK
jgi:hypothetical protein